MPIGNKEPGWREAMNGSGESIRASDHTTEASVEETYGESKFASLGQVTSTTSKPIVKVDKHASEIIGLSRAAHDVVLSAIVSKKSVEVTYCPRTMRNKT